MRLVIITPPATEPLTLAQAKAELKIDFADDDANITSKLTEARMWAETYLRRALVSRVVEYGFDAFPGDSTPIRLPLGKCTAIEYIKYLDDDGATQTLSGPTSAAPGTDYIEDLTDDYGAVIAPPWDDYWPTTRKTLNAITVRYTAGYGAAAAVPSDIVTGVRSRLSDLYEVRGAVDVPRRGRDWFDVAESLLHPWRIRTW